MGESKMNHDVFISFSFDDQEIAENIVNSLTSKYGISCWICTRDINGGEHYKDLIPEAIDAAQVVVFIQSSHAVESKEIPKEIGMAFDADKTIIPFRVDDAKLTGKLRYDLYGIEYIDATVPTMEQRISDLAKSISNAIMKPLSTESKAVMTPVLKSTKVSCNEIFAGRDKLIEAIHTDFQQRNVIFLCGMGGIGKSQLACQYWKRYRDFYTTVVFGRYKSGLIELIADDTVFNVEGVTRKTKADNSLQTDDEYAREKLTVLKKSADQHTLIIIDNYNQDTDDHFFDEFVGDVNCRILVTGRREPRRRDKYHVISVDEIDDNALKDIFIQYANPNKTIIEMDDPNFHELFEMTNRHTYTLELLAKYMEEKDDVDEICELIKLLKEEGFATISKDGYDTIRNLFRLTSLDEKEKTFMRCLTMMPLSGVRQKLFKQWIGDAFSARSRLVDLSLVKINGTTKTIEMHPIIKEVVLTDLKPTYENCKDFVNRCAMVGEDRIPLMWKLSYEEKKMYFDCYMGIVEIMGKVTAETFSAYENISVLYNYVGNYRNTIRFHEEIYRFSCEYYGEFSEESMLILNRIGWKHSSVFNYESAIDYLKKSADWFIENPNYSSREAHSVIQLCGDACIALYEKNHIYSYLEDAYYYTEKYSDYGRKMLDCTEEESELFKTQLKYQLALINRTYFKMYLREKKYDEAERALNDFREAIGTYIAESKITEFVDMAALYRDLGILNFEKQLYNDAILALEESYKVYRKFFSDRNGRVIGVVDLLIQCYLQVGNKAEAKKYIEIISEIAKSIYTKEHPIFSQIHEYKRLLSLTQKNRVGSYPLVE